MYVHIFNKKEHFLKFVIYHLQLNLKLFYFVDILDTQKNPSFSKILALHNTDIWIRQKTVFSSSGICIIEAYLLKYYFEAHM